MKDPRSLAANSGQWLTDTRVYNLLWLGRSMERAEDLLRALDTGIRVARDHGGTQAELSKALDALASAWGIRTEAEDNVRLVLQGDQSSSVLRSLQNARDNATQVAPLEFIQAINRVLEHTAALELDEVTVEQLQQHVTDLLNELLEAYQIVETRWFRSAPISEEEVYRRFLQ